MSDDLTISGSGSTAVASDALYSSAQQLQSLAVEAAVLARHLGIADRSTAAAWVGGVVVPPSAVRADGAMDEAARLLADLEVTARQLEGALLAVAEGYGFIDWLIGVAVERVAGDVAAAAGMFAPVWVPLVTPTIVVGGAVVAGLSMIPGAKDAAGEFMRENNELLTNPLTATIVREASMAADDAMMGAIWVPRPVAQLIGDEGLGLVGLSTAASAVMIAGSTVGVFRESPVQLVSQTTTTVSGPPAGYVERLGRVPDTDQTGGAQVIIEKYETPEQPDRYEVYIAGTVTFDPVSDAEPFDMTSNMSNAVGPGSAAYDSVAEAMRLAGIDENSLVQFTGYSQGGGTAAQLAASGDYNTQGLATFGGPTGQVAIPEGFTTVIVEHEDDIVPALGGSQENLHAVIVERDVFGGREVPTDYAVPAHHYEYYQQTARLMDGASSTQLTQAIDALDRFGAGATTVTSTAYRFERDQ